MANSTKPKGTPVKAAKTSQSPNQPSGITDSEQDTTDDLGKEDEEPDTDVEDEVVVEHDSSIPPPVDNEHVQSDADSYGDTSGPNPAAASAPAGPGSVTSAPGTGSSVDPTPESEPQKPQRHIRDRLRDIETRWGKDLEEVIINMHDHIFGTSEHHEVTTAKRKAKEDAEKTEADE